MAQEKRSLIDRLAQGMQEEDESPRYLLNQLLEPPNPSLHPGEEDKWLRKRELWYVRKARLLAKGWPEILASIGARFDRRKRFWRKQERDVDFTLNTLRREGYTEEEVAHWAELNVLKGKLLDKAIKQLMDRYKGSLEGESSPPVFAFQSGARHRKRSASRRRRR